MVMMTPPLAGRPLAPGLRVLVVGGGASGVLLAAQLLERGRGQVAVTILEKGAMLGCGVAYSTPDPRHLLNTRVANMSAYPDRPEHFFDWLRGREGREVDPQGFVSRGTYGRYMQALLDPWEDTAALACWQGECLDLEVHSDGVTAHLAGGARVEADLAVLATGHTLPEPAQTPGVSQPWAGPAAPCDGHILIVGSGLTMVAQVLSLLACGHEGTITAISRRRLLPQVHRPTDPMCFRAEELPQPMRIASLMRWLRAQARAREEAGGDWRDVVDGLRPHLQAIWRALPLASRRSFLRHASPYWEVHRHRMPPASHERLVEARGEGRLRLLRGRFEGAPPGAEGRLVARIAGPDGRHRELPVSRIVDCRGIRRDPEAHATPLIAGLLASGTARLDPLRVGLDVAPDCGVRRADGEASGRLFAMGPASRAAFWEITAIPDIRAQAARLAEHLLERVPA
ncbi:MAG TPA: FAD/NAD(P)-binding protein [Rubellimicrobium sp.]|nr:FAD/NAD(P)-binding protein [Rubellimicrobium sp.]